MFHCCGARLESFFFIDLVGQAKAEANQEKFLPGGMCFVVLCLGVALDAGEGAHTTRIPFLFSGGRSKWIASDFFRRGRFMHIFVLFLLLSKAKNESPSSRPKGGCKVRGRGGGGVPGLEKGFWLEQTSQGWGQIFASNSLDNPFVCDDFFLPAQKGVKKDGSDVLNLNVKQGYVF